MTTTRAAVVPGFARSSDGPRTSPAVAVERLRTNLRRDIRWVARGISESCAAVVDACRRRLARGVCGIFVRPPVILFRVFPVHCGIEGVVYRGSNRGVQLARLGRRRRLNSAGARDKRAASASEMRIRSFFVVEGAAIQPPINV